MLWPVLNRKISHHIHEAEDCVGLRIGLGDEEGKLMYSFMRL